jgi:hypothetical protein
MILDANQILINIFNFHGRNIDVSMQDLCHSYCPFLLFHPYYGLLQDRLYLLD